MITHQSPENIGVWMDACTNSPAERWFWCDFIDIQKLYVTRKPPRKPFDLVQFRVAKCLRQYSVPMCTAPRLGLELYRLFDITADHWKERRTPIFVGSVSKTRSSIALLTIAKASESSQEFKLRCGS
ncbi:hypothetical protein P5673_016540 [Acropora cervicornis]|uniref:Uncharacterized protein n=1 Tax=Acropora cervicornis TaxID=6130 RepID=A0AAD9QH16_ACRCE|nr:hypothetical protein P5673_016540 [Acropora cervicornis]